MSSNQWILFLKKNKGSGKDTTTLSREYRELYGKTIVYPYVRRDISEEKRMLCRGKTHAECQSHIADCYWKPKSNNCARRPDRSAQINVKLQKNARVQFNMKPEIFPVSKPGKPVNRSNRKPDPCGVYSDPLNCFSDENCVFSNGVCNSRTPIQQVKRIINMDDVWGGNRPPYL